MLKQLLVCLAVVAGSHSAAAADPLVHTFSIVAPDQVTGDIGIAVQSHRLQ